MILKYKTYFPHPLLNFRVQFFIMQNQLVTLNEFDSVTNFNSD